MGRLSWLTLAGGALVTVGAVLFAGNMGLVVERHSPRSLRSVLFGSLGESAGDTG